MIPFLIGPLTCLGAFFRSRYNLGLEILAYVSSWAYSGENILALGSESRIEYFGLSSAGFGLPGATPWSSSNPKRLSPGIGLAFACAGACDRTPGTWAGPRSIATFELSSGGWRTRIPPGARREFTASSSSLAWTFPSARLPLSPAPVSSDDARQLWSAFLRNHRDVIAAMDLFTVPTLTFRVLYCFFVIEHGRRKVLHFNVTEHPSSSWIAQQLREAFPESCPYRYAILDRDGKFGEEVTDLLTASGMSPQRITPASFWQNGVAERWIGSCRRDLLDHVLIFN